MNKFDAINKVLTSDLQAQDKCLLIELIVRADEDWVSWPSVERLCKVRGIKHEKNFKGADFYLPGLVTKTKRGRKNTYTLNIKGIEELRDASIAIKHTPALEGVYTPAAPDNTPAQADNTPSAAGANTTYNTTRENTIDTTGGVDSISSNKEFSDTFSNEEWEEDLSTTKQVTPAQAGVLDEDLSYYSLAAQAARKAAHEAYLNEW